MLIYPKNIEVKKVFHSITVNSKEILNLSFKTCHKHEEIMVKIAPPPHLHPSHFL